MVKKIIILGFMVIIPVIAAVYGFQVGSKQFVVSAAEPKNEIELSGLDKSDNGFSDAESMLRKIVWKHVGLKETVHAFEYTSENSLYLETGFTSVEKDLKKVLKLLKEIEEKCGQVVENYLITFNENGNKKLMELQFKGEALAELEFESIKHLDLINLASNVYLDEAIKIVEE